MVHTLMDKLPDIFLIYFYREGVIHEIKALRDGPLKAMVTPRAEAKTPPLAVATPPLPAPVMSSPAGTAPVGQPLQTTPPGPSHIQTTPPGPSHTPNSTRRCVQLSIRYDIRCDCVYTSVQLLTIFYTIGDSLRLFVEGSATFVARSRGVAARTNNPPGHPSPPFHHFRPPRGGNQPPLVPPRWLRGPAHPRPL